MKFDENLCKCNAIDKACQNTLGLAVTSM